MTKREKALYSCKAGTTGGGDGAARCNDGGLNTKLSSPGGPGIGTEQLLAVPFPRRRPISRLVQQHPVIEKFRCRNTHGGRTCFLH
jgi:hypothetical protein